MSCFYLAVSSQKSTTLAWYFPSDSHIPLGFLLICALRKISRPKMFVIQSSAVEVVFSWPFVVTGEKWKMIVWSSYIGSLSDEESHSSLDNITCNDLISTKETRVTISVNAHRQHVIYSKDYLSLFPLLLYLLNLFTIAAILFQA